MEGSQPQEHMVQLLFEWTLVQRYQGEQNISKKSNVD